MSKETLEYLQGGNIVVGGIAERGLPWWAEDKWVSGDSRAMTELRSEYRTPGGRQLFWDNFIPADAILGGPFGWTALEIEPEVRIGNQYVPMDGYKAIVRNDTQHTMGVFKQSYQPAQPAQLVDLAMDLLSNDVGFTSAGVLREGAVLWLEASVNHEFHCEAAGFGFVPNLLISTSFNGTLANEVVRTHRHSVCDNTHEQARNDAVARIKGKHTINGLPKLSLQGSMIGLIEQEAADYDRELTEMFNTPVNGKQMAGFLDMWNPIPDWKEGEPTNKLTIATKKRESIMQMWVSDPRVSPWKGTKLGVHQLINTYNQHGYAEEDAGKRFEKNMLNVINGNIGKADNEAFKMLDLVLAN